MSTPVPIPSPVTSPEADPDVAFLRQLLPTETPLRKRAFSLLLRQIVSEKGPLR